MSYVLFLVYIALSVIVGFVLGSNLLALHIRGEGKVRIGDHIYSSEKYNKCVTGGHCGLCGVWMTDEKVEKGWEWSVCDKCLNL